MKSESDSRFRWTLLGVAIGIAFLWLALRNAELDDAWQALTGLRTQWILPILGCTVLFMAIKSWRWYLLLRPAMGIAQNSADLGGSFRMLHRAVYAGTAANLVVAHTGELLRATLIARRSGIAASAVLTSIALERVLDFAALLILVGLAFLIDPAVSTLLWSAALVSIALIVFGLAVLGTLTSSRESRIRHYLIWLLRFLPSRIADWIVVHLDKSRAGLHAIHEPLTLVKVLALSLTQWFCIVLSIWACAIAVGVDISLSAAITVFVLTVIGLTLPSSPAQLGTVQLAFVAGLATVNSPAAPALAASLLYTGLVNGTMMIIGAVCWFRWRQAHSQEPKSPTRTESV